MVNLPSYSLMQLQLFPPLFSSLSRCVSTHTSCLGCWWPAHSPFLYPNPRCWQWHHEIDTQDKRALRGTYLDFCTCQLSFICLFTQAWTCVCCICEGTFLFFSLIYLSVQLLGGGLLFVFCFWKRTQNYKVFLCREDIWEELGERKHDQNTLHKKYFAGAVSLRRAQYSLYQWPGPQLALSSNQRSWIPAAKWPVWPWSTTVWPKRHETR